MPLRPAQAPIVSTLTGDRPAQGAGEFVPDRDLWTTTLAQTIAAGTLTLSHWTADKSEPINTVRVVTGGTAAAATPTLCRMGIYSVNAAGDLTALLASTANDTTLFAAITTAYSRALTSTFDKVAGQRYATALLVVTGAAIPVFIGSSGPTAATAQWQHLFDLPAKASRVAGQADLGASYTRAQQTSTPYRIGFTLT